MLLSGFGQVVHPGHHGLATSDAFADMQGVGAPMSDHERLAALVGNPLAPHQPPRADPGADASTYYSGCVRKLSPPNAREYSSVTSGTRARRARVNHETPRETPRVMTDVKSATRPEKNLFFSDKRRTRSLFFSPRHPSASFVVAGARS